MRKALHAMVTCLIAATVLEAAEVPTPLAIDNLPPSVVKTVPRCGDTNVDPDLKEIAVTFSKDMMDQTWSWCHIRQESFPKLNGDPQYQPDKRTCVIKVTLEPEKTYAMWINKDQFKGFKDASQRPAVPYLLVFKTGPGK
jgi:hypothetical protein